MLVSFVELILPVIVARSRLRSCYHLIRLCEFSCIFLLWSNGASFNRLLICLSIAFSADPDEGRRLRDWLMGGIAFQARLGVHRGIFNSFSKYRCIQAKFGTQFQVIEISHSHDCCTVRVADEQWYLGRLSARTPPWTHAARWTSWKCLLSAQDLFFGSSWPVCWRFCRLPYLDPLFCLIHHRFPFQHPPAWQLSSASRKVLRDWTLPWSTLMPALVKSLSRTFPSASTAPQRRKWNSSMHRSWHSSGAPARHQNRKSPS